MKHTKSKLDASEGYFLLGDSLNTTVTLISTLQNDAVSFNTLHLTYLLLVGIASQVSSEFCIKDMVKSKLILIGSWHICVLVDSTKVSAWNKSHVQCDSLLHYSPRWLGNDWHLDRYFWLPSCLGILGKHAFTSSNSTFNGSLLKNNATSR